MNWGVQINSVERKRERPPLAVNKSGFWTTQGRAVPQEQDPLPHPRISPVQLLAWKLPEPPPVSRPPALEPLIIFIFRPLFLHILRHFCPSLRFRVDSVDLPHSFGLRDSFVSLHSLCDPTFSLP
ncbi:hypothetical protein BDW62DRAFT_35505 [Aspergillus aurantiobrunneus]